MNIGVASSNLNFFGSVHKELAKHHTIYKYNHTNDANNDHFQIGSMNATCDVFFIDFVQTPMEIVLQLNKPIVARMHRIEVYNFMRDESLLSKQTWKNVSLIFSSNHIQERFFDYIKDMGKENLLTPKRWVVIPTNGVDLNLFKAKPRQRENIYQMCIVGNITPKKRTYDLISALIELPGWHLNIVGTPMTNGGYGNFEYHINCHDLVKELQLEDRVHFLGHIPIDSMPDFFNTQDIIISNSNEEGTHVSIAEAMACGVYPLLNCWRGVGDIYPKENVFRNQTEMIEMIKVWEGMSDEGKNDMSEKYIKYVQSRYNAEELAVKVREFVEGSVEQTGDAVQ